MQEHSIELHLGNRKLAKTPKLRGLNMGKSVLFIVCMKSKKKVRTYYKKV